MYFWISHCTVPSIFIRCTTPGAFPYLAVSVEVSIPYSDRFLVPKLIGQHDVRMCGRYASFLPAEAVARGAVLERRADAIRHGSAQAPRQASVT